ncbi:dipeptidase [Aureococcus anophagefferens]|nr:dipeptidase [Aureococcus anophagefferens]
MIEWTKAWEKLGCSEARLVENPKKGEDDTLPPMLLVTFDCETQIPNEQAVRFTATSTQPAKKADGWDTEPFELTETDDGSRPAASDDKGPALSWLWAVEAHRKLGLKLPVRLKLLYEGMEERLRASPSSSPPRRGRRRVDAKKQEVTLDFKDAGWLADVDHFVVEMIHGGPAWVSKTENPNYAAARAVERVFARSRT